MEHSVAFTGHRNYTGQKDDLLPTLRLLYAQGKRQFLSGMALGFDLAAAEAVLALREEHPDVRLVAVVPFEGQERTFPPNEQERFAQILRQADRVEVLAKAYRKEVYALRNNYLIDHASLLVTWYDGHVGGTRYTVRRALKHHVRLIHLCPATPLEAYSQPELFQ